MNTKELIRIAEWLEYGCANPDKLDMNAVRSAAAELRNAATQPSQDERGQSIEAIVSKTISDTEPRRVESFPVDVKFDPDANKGCVKIPVALSTLTDEQIDIITTNIWGSQLGVMYPAFREYARDILAAQQPTPPQPVAAEGLTGDALIRNAQALLNLDADGALVPHGIGGHARAIIQAFIAQGALK